MTLGLPPPSLPGMFQLDNAGIAIAALRASGLTVPDAAIGAGIAAAEWPARMQRLTGRLAAMLPPDWELWLDGGHNPGAGVVLAEHLRGWADRPVHLLVGMKQSKDSEQFLRPLLPLATTLWAVAEDTSMPRVRSRRSLRLRRRRSAGAACRRRVARGGGRARAGARADLRQPLSGRRGIATRCVSSCCWRRFRPPPGSAPPRRRCGSDYQIIEWQTRNPAQLAALKSIGVTAAAVIPDRDGTGTPIEVQTAPLRQVGLRW